MTSQKKVFIISINIIISFCLAFILWDYIEFEYVDNGIIGIYSEKNFNPINDIIRYIVFVLIPVTSFFLTKYYYDKNFFLKLKNLFLKEPISYINDKELPWAAFFLVSIFIILEFLSVSFPIHKLDSFHEGQKLSSAYKSLIDGSLWSGSYVTIGIFFEILSSKIIWNIFDHISIGLTRYLEILFILIQKILLVLLLFIFTNFLKFWITDLKMIKR